MVSRAVISLRLAGRGRRIVAATTVISLLGALSALIDYRLSFHGSVGAGGDHGVVVLRSPAENAGSHIPLGPQANQFFAKTGKQNRADYDDVNTRAESAIDALDKQQFVAASLTPLEMGAGPRVAAPFALPQQDVNRGGKADRLSLPQLAVNKLIAPVIEEPQDATGTSAALFFISPPPNATPVSAVVAAAPAPVVTADAAPASVVAEDAPAEGPTLAALAAAKATSPGAKPSQSTWSDLVQLASVSGGDGEKIGSNIFGGLTEKEFQAREFRCMATAIYFEARGESVKGQIAVGQVIMTRVRSMFYPSTICGVVFQGQWNKNACQFSFACDGVPDTPKNRKQWDTALDVAKNVISGKVYLDEVGDATHYHATYVSPDWKKMVKRITKIGVHIFYKAPFVEPIVASNDFKKL
jgi:spore germination cell wall hydrolase CwlJ-like protein